MHALLVHFQAFVQGFLKILESMQENHTNDAPQKEKEHVYFLSSYQMNSTTTILNCNRAVGNSLKDNFILDYLVLSIYFIRIAYR